MWNEKISVIIPAYNIEKEIERCVNSVLAQSVYNIEVIIVNDGSTDRTLDILYRLEKQDKRVRLIDKINEGVSKARLSGVEIATGEWVGFVDGDDYIEPDMYERLLSNAEKYQADISHCGYQMVFPSRVDYYYNTGTIIEQDNVKGLKDLLSGSFVEPGVWNKLFRKKLFHKLLSNDCMDLSIKNTEDLLMNYYLFKEAKASVYEDFCPYHYIVRANSAANKAINEHQLLDPLRVTEHLLVETKNKPELFEIVQRKRISNLISLSTISTQKNSNLISPIRKNARHQLRNHLIGIITSRNYSIKLKLQAVWAGVWPASYHWVHYAYEKITGLDKKYEIS